MVANQIRFATIFLWVQLHTSGGPKVRATSFIGGIKCWTVMMVYSLIAAPFGEIAQGLIVKEKSLTWGGFVGLAIGMVSICCVTGKIPLLANWFMPLFIIFWVVMMIVPGHIINHKAKKG